MEVQELKGKSVAVVGLGARTGVSLVKYLCAHGAIVTAFDAKERKDLSDTLAEVKNCTFDLKVASDSTRIGPSDLVLVSPGVPIDHPMLVDAKSRRIPVWSEIEFASRNIKAPIVAITGTNGKSTTTSLVAHILKAWGKSVFAGGNLGTPLLEAVNKTFDFVVAEISSFQLEAVEQFHPKVGILLNISSNHLDRHHTMETYIAMKKRLFARMTDEDVAVTNIDDRFCREIAKGLKARVLYFSGVGSAQADIRVRPGRIETVEGNVSTERIKLVGTHNLENVAAAVAAVQSLGCPLSVIEKGIETFEGLPHRLQFVAEVNGIRFYNDSKSTTPDATLHAVESFERPVVLLAGGKPKGASYEALEKIQRRLKRVILFGPAGKPMSDVLRETPTERVENVKSAVEKAFEGAESGDVVLFSPGNSSFDEFNDFEERGDYFRSLVLEIGGGS